MLSEQPSRAVRWGPTVKSSFVASFLYPGLGFRSFQAPINHLFSRIEALFDDFYVGVYPPASGKYTAYLTPSLRNSDHTYALSENSESK